MAYNVRNFLLKYCTTEEKKEYIDYTRGDKTQDKWLEKALMQREKLILELPICLCGESININEYGICKCSSNHYGYNVILGIIENS
jgi:hypothetical protein